jgi:hypothetical protein
MSVLISQVVAHSAAAFLLYNIDHVMGVRTTAIKEWIRRGVKHPIANAAVRSCLQQRLHNLHVIFIGCPYERGLAVLLTN